MTIIDDAQNRNHKQSATEDPSRINSPRTEAPPPTRPTSPPAPTAGKGQRDPHRPKSPENHLAMPQSTPPAPHTSQDRGLKAPSNKLHHSNARTPQTKLNARKFYRLASIQAAVIKIRLSFLLESFKLGFKIN